MKDQLKADSLMLSQINIMDYSLLLGIENRPKSEEKEMMTPGGGRQSRIRAEMRRLTVKNNMDVAALRRHRFISPDSY